MPVSDEQIAIMRKDGYLMPAEIAARCGVHETTVRRFVKLHALREVHVGNVVYVDALEFARHYTDHPALRARIVEGLGTTPRRP